MLVYSCGLPEAVVDDNDIKKIGNWNDDVLLKWILHRYSSRLGALF